ncbi:hypothetical protein EMIT0196P_190027 [Pseudomonas chlororaphis]
MSHGTTIQKDGRKSRGDNRTATTNITHAGRTHGIDVDIGASRSDRGGAMTGEWADMFVAQASSGKHLSPQVAIHENSRPASQRCDAINDRRSRR